MSRQLAPNGSSGVRAGHRHRHRLRAGTSAGPQDPWLQGRCRLLLQEKAAVDGNAPEHRQPRPRRGLVFNIGKVKAGAWGLVTSARCHPGKKGFEDRALSLIPKRNFNFLCSPCRQEITEQRMRAADASLARGSLRRR